MADFGRVLTAMVTPMNKDGEVDYGRAAEIARHLINTGSDGIVVAGTTGESPTLSREEKLRLFEKVSETVKSMGDGYHVIAGTGSNSTKASIELTIEAEKCGVTGIMLVAPYYNKPTQEGLYRHFKAIAESTSLPVIIYNIPGRTSVNITPETFARLAEIDNIVAVKESSGNLVQVAEIRRATPRDFLVYSGDDALALPIVALGGAGVISVAAHLAGMKIKRMIEAYLEGEVELAWRIHSELLPLFKALFITTNPMQVKAAMRLIGLDAGPVRLPLVDATEDELQKVADALKGLGII